MRAICVPVGVQLVASLTVVVVVADAVSLQQGEKRSLVLILKFMSRLGKTEIVECAACQGECVCRWCVEMVGQKEEEVRREM
ncbi:MAG: hypothetical protein CL799_03000 [Chromatiales bacterium]|nr:hypothetical protein [Chromatiales bacterium]